MCLSSGRKKFTQHSRSGEFVDRGLVGRGLPQKKAGKHLRIGEPQYCPLGWVTLCCPIVLLEVQNQILDRLNI